MELGEDIYEGSVESSGTGSTGSQGFRNETRSWCWEREVRRENGGRDNRTSLSLLVHREASRDSLFNGQVIRGPARILENPMGIKREEPVFNSEGRRASTRGYTEKCRTL